MASSAFFGLNVALQGLYTAQGSLNTTAHNTSNVNTPGYSKQVTTQSATQPMQGVGAVGMIGTGSEIISIDQQRNFYYDVKYWNNNKYLGEYSVKEQMLAQLEYIFNEPSDAGFAKEMTILYEKMSQLSTNPSDEAYRSTVISQLDSFTSYFNSMSELLNQVQSEANFGVKTTIEEINSYADEVANLNKQIVNYELGGVKANDLRDQRATLIDKLSLLIPITVTERNEGLYLNRTTITINGQLLVDGEKANYLECTVREDVHNPEDILDLYDIRWVTGQDFYMADTNLAGELKAYIDARDGNNNQNLRKLIASSTPADVANGIPATITINNPSRTDIAKSGAITIDGVDVKYTDMVYDTTSDTMTFTIDINSPMPDAPEYMEMGNSMSFKGISYYKSRLNEFVRVFAMEMNKIHEQGVNLDGETGIPLFVYEGYTGTPPLDVNDVNTYNGINIANIKINPDILASQKKFATTRSIVQGVEGNDIVMEMMNLRHDMSVFKQGKPENYYQSVIAELSIDSKQSQDFVKGQTNIVTAIENTRQSIMGVDINEEAANMVKYQAAYDLAAQMIRVMNEVYDTLIKEVR